ncbi:hypothetical protein AAFC00_003525 [Neodothiora populina]|uniref:U3 small nucleolar RNA-associated protein 11 n=1 Tax=Neodothiora populina TaxID=2781224 RepID=A0ABR3PEI3_9PEZI
MSSMRNAVQRRNHKERAQPLERQKWGILEKHKDYSLRAKDHNEKKRRIKLLKQKAADRNPDEFAFGMMSTTTKNGVKITQRGKENGNPGVLSMDVVKLLKTQDAGYLTTILQQTKREKEKVQKDVMLAGVGVDTAPANKKKSFDDDGMEIRGPVEDMDADMDDDDFSFSDSGDESAGDDGEAAAEQGLTKEQIQVRRRKRHAREVLQGRLQALTAREKDLTSALFTLENQRAKMSNTVGGTNKNGVKFKIRERKR